MTVIHQEGGRLPRRLRAGRQASHPTLLGNCCAGWGNLQAPKQVARTVSLPLAAGLAALLWYKLDAKP